MVRLGLTLGFFFPAAYFLPMPRSTRPRLCFLASVLLVFVGFIFRPTSRHALRVIDSWSASDSRWNFAQPPMPESEDSAFPSQAHCPCRLCPRMDMPFVSHPAQLPIIAYASLQAHCLLRRAYIRPTSGHVLRVTDSWSASDSRWKLAQPPMPECKRTAWFAGLMLGPRLDMPCMS